MIRAYFLLYFFLIGNILFIIFGYFSYIHPLFDSFSHFRIQLFFMLIFLILLLIFMHKNKYRYIYIISLFIASIYLYFLNKPFVFIHNKTKISKTFTHMQFNLNFRNTELDNVVNFIEKNTPDIITLQEVTKDHQYTLEKLKNSLYPYQKYCDFYPVVGAVAILSQYPLVDNSSMCLKGKGLLTTKVKIDKDIITVVSLHLHWPFPYDQYKQYDILENIFEELTPPVLIAGDFNAAPWSHIVNKISMSSNTKVVNGVRWSLDIGKLFPTLSIMKLPIDHVLLSEDIFTTYIHSEDYLGSDHFPIMSENNIIDRR